MKSYLKLLFISLIFLFFSNNSLNSYYVTYKEQFYNLYHIHYQQYPDDCIENIYWLERAAKADFANPQAAFTKITNKTEWEKYRYLFMMHINLKLIEQHLRLGRIYDKQIAYFYDAPWKEDYLADLEKTLNCYKATYYYWEEAKKWSDKTLDKKFNFITLTGIQNWEDENYRIQNKTLDYKKIIDREVARVEKVINDFIAMDENTY